MLSAFFSKNITKNPEITNIEIKIKNNFHCSFAFIDTKQGG